MSMPSATPATTIRLSDETRAQVDKFAKLTRRSRSFVIQEAVENYLKDRIEYIEGIEQALNEVKSGYGHSHAQVKAWVKTLGTENEMPIPEPDITPKSS